MTTNNEACISAIARRLSVVIIWIIAIGCAIIVTTVSPQVETLSWLSIALAACIICTFAIQVSLRQKIGLVDRITASLTGATIILGAVAILTHIANAP